MTINDSRRPASFGSTGPSASAAVISSADNPVALATSSTVSSARRAGGVKALPQCGVRGPRRTQHQLVVAFAHRAERDGDLRCTAGAARGAAGHPLESAEVRLLVVD